jgi:hypothetical protein
MDIYLVWYIHPKTVGNQLYIVCRSPSKANRHVKWLEDKGYSAWSTISALED